MLLDGPSPIIPHYPSPTSPLITVSFFFISMSLVIFCFLVFFNLFFLIVVQAQLSPFSPPHAPLPHSSPPSTLKPTPFGFIHVSFIYVPWKPFPYFPLLPCSLLPSGYCQFLLYFSVSGSILLACLFCWLGSTYRCMKDLNRHFYKEDKEGPETYERMLSITSHQRDAN